MLKPEVKQKWLEALRSGQYQQTKSTLREEVDQSACFCCLGVLCDISNQGEWSNDCYQTEEGKQSSVPPRPVTKWAFDEDFVSLVSLNNPEEFLIALAKTTDSEGKGQRIRNVDLSHSVLEALAETNDSGATFEQIAQVIDKYL